MKIGVISDTHISSPSKNIPTKILEPFKDMDMIIHAGDLVDLSVLDIFRSVCPNVKAVWGNMDPADVRRCLPNKEIIPVMNHRIGLTHGRGSPDSLIETVTKIFKDDNIDIIIFGHSHSPINQKRGGVLYFNPGSLTDNIYAPYNTYGVIKIDDNIKSDIVRIKV